MGNKAFAKMYPFGRWLTNCCPVHVAHKNDKDIRKKLQLNFHCPSFALDTQTSQCYNGVVILVMDRVVSTALRKFHACLKKWDTFFSKTVKTPIISMKAAD